MVFFFFCRQAEQMANVFVYAVGSMLFRVKKNKNSSLLVSGYLVPGSFLASSHLVSPPHSPHLSLTFAYPLLSSPHLLTPLLMSHISSFSSASSIYLSIYPSPLLISLFLVSPFQLFVSSVARQLLWDFS